MWIRLIKKEINERDGIFEYKQSVTVQMHDRVNINKRE